MLLKTAAIEINEVSVFFLLLFDLIDNDVLCFSGGSCIKLVYSLGENNEKGDSLIIRMTSFSSTKLKEAMEFLKKRLGSGIQSGEKIFTTGVGCHIEENFINSELGIK